jgi:hypothetical protein
MSRPRRDGTPSLSPRRARLTQRYVESLQPETLAYQVRDSKQKGFLVRVQPSGHKTWKLVYRHNYITRWFHIGRVGAVDIVTARKIAQRMAGQAAFGLDPVGQRINASTETRNTKAAARSIVNFVGNNGFDGIPVGDAIDASEAEPTVYFIKIGRAVKVGYTIHIDKRIKELRHASAEPMTVLACLPGDRELEKHLHRALSEARIMREFFEEQAVRSLLASIKTAAMTVVTGTSVIAAPKKRTPQAVRPRG